MSKKGGGEGGVISNPKNFIANLRKLTHIYKFSQKKAQCNFQKWGGGGGSKAVWEFSKKTSSLGNPVTPQVDVIAPFSFAKIQFQIVGDFERFMPPSFSLLVVMVSIKILYSKAEMWMQKWPIKNKLDNFRSFFGYFF